MADLVQVLHLPDRQLGMHPVVLQRLARVFRIVNDKHELAGDEDEMEETKNRDDDAESEEEPQDDEYVLVSDVLADLANHLMPMKM